MTAFIHHFSYEFHTGLRNKSLLLMNYLLPLGFYFMVGSFMSSVNPLFTEVMIPAMIIFAILSGTIVGLPSPIIEAREGDILRSYRINGVPSLSILAIPAITTGIHLLLVGLVITTTAPILFNAPMATNPAAFALCFLVTLFACCGLGQLIGVVSANTQSATVWSQLIYIPSMLIGGLMVPADMLPAGLQKAGMLLPGTHAMQAFRGLAMGLETAFSPWLSLSILLAGGLTAFGLASFLFSWDNRNTERRGHTLLGLLALLPYLASIILLP